MNPQLKVELLMYNYTAIKFWLVSIVCLKTIRHNKRLFHTAQKEGK
jgi:hypothetical protein